MSQAKWATNSATPWGLNGHYYNFMGWPEVNMWGARTKPQSWDINKDFNFINTALEAGPLGQLAYINSTAERDFMVTLFE